MDMNEVLERIGACKSAREWVASQPDAQTAWDNCPNWQWMDWLLDQCVPYPLSVSVQYDLFDELWGEKLGKSSPKEQADAIRKYVPRAPEFTEEQVSKIEQELWAQADDDLSHEEDDSYENEEY